ncbi:transient receptor potential cation channel subfamily M member 2, partial [Biomphalaria glabrata]
AYEDIANKVLDSCYKKDRKSTWYLLIENISLWNESCITVAFKTENKQFLKERACADVNSVIWSYYLGQTLNLSN